MDVAKDKVRMLVLEARRLTAGEGRTNPDDGSNPIDDGGIGGLAASPDDDAITREFTGLVRGMNDDEKAATVALCWVGRGDYDVAEWEDAVDLARERTGEGDTARYLLGIPNLADVLEEGMAAHDGLMTDEPEDEAVHRGGTEAENQAEDWSSDERDVLSRRG